MNRVYLTGLALGVLITGYVVLDRSAQEPSIIKTDYAAEANIPSIEKAQLNTNIDNTQTSQPDSSPRETEAQEVNLASQYQEAVRAFEVLTPSEQFQQRKSSLSKLITGNNLSIANEVSLQQEWERAGRAEPDHQHESDITTININGIDIDYGQPGVIVADQVMVYVPKSKRSLLRELVSVSGIETIEPVFKGAESNNVPGQRDLSSWQKITLKVPANRIKAIASALESFDGINEAEPVYERKLSVIPPLVQDLDDPLTSEQWHLDAANIKNAWDYLEANDLPAGGDDSIVVAVIDTGVDYNHPDLSANMWVNTQEIPDNGIDDDNNGFVDDIHGVAVVSASSSHSGDPDDDHGHGTHVAGIIASTGGNDLGGVGVAYNSKIMAIKAAQYSGVLTTADIAEAIYYAVDNGADVINMSFGGYSRSGIEEDALALAYTNAILVASAGNDARANSSRCLGSPFYPASYAWVLGVMASAETPDVDGDYLTGFSNFDCIQGDNLEYELMAPGSAIWSTLPNGSYSAWSGTSMSAPVVSGIAALARTRWPDKSSYSSRFIMGQVGSTGSLTQGYTPRDGSDPLIYPRADGHSALTSVPKPKLSFEEFFLFDGTEQGESNDGDGSVDAGERIELAIVIRNRWGKASDVVATLSTPSGASSSDPYVSLETASVNYGAVGSFNKDDNGIEYDDGFVVTGVNNPFVFSVDANTPNNHVIPFTLTITAKNGLDTGDGADYTFTSTFPLVVQRGRELPSIIDGDLAGTDGGLLDTDGIEDGVVTLDSSALWIIDKGTLVSRGTTLKITEASQMQFGVATSPGYIQVEGKIIFIGTVANPVSVFPNPLYPDWRVNMSTVNEGEIQMSYTDILNLNAESEETGQNYTKVDFNVFSVGSYGNVALPKSYGSAIGNRVHKLGASGNYLPSGWDMTLADGHVGCMPRYCSSNHEKFSATNSVFLKNRHRSINSQGNEYFYNNQFRFGSTDYAIVNPFEYGDNTYAVFYNVNDPNEIAVKTARAFAESMGGTLFTVSSQDEMIAVNNWRSTNYEESYWTENYEFCNLGTSCDSTFESKKYFVGYSQNSEGTWSWDGGDNSYGDTFLETQQYWNPKKWHETCQGTAHPTITEEPNPLLSTDDASKTLILQPQGSSGEEHNICDSSWYNLVSQDTVTGQGNNTKLVVIEVPGALSQSELDAGLSSFKSSSSTNFKFYNNAILGVWYDTEDYKLPYFYASAGDSNRVFDYFSDISQNYWGGASDARIDELVTDSNDNFNLATFKFKPKLEIPPETAYPFVVNVEVLDSDGSRPNNDRFSAQASKWRITFNRDMDTTKQPLVTFGPAEPFTDFTIQGDWTDARTWEGSFTFTSITGDGLQYIRVVGGVAADNARLVTGDDSERFRFELITSGVEALTLQAAGLTDQVSLEWMQDDFDLLHGYNLYRSMSENGSYVRINSSTINKSILEFVDVDVTPGIPHYYYFTVVTDSGESSPSNIAMATPVDTIDPVITHKTETVVSLDDSLTLRANVTDNIAVASVTMVFRNASSSTWQTREMLETDTDRYSVTMGASDIGNQYLEYYIEVKDAVNTVTSGSAESPYKVFVSLPSDTDTDGDGVNNADDAFPYDPSETTDLDGDGIGDNADPDDDGDNYNDDVDEFPRDASEWIDTDGDGIGNNRDSDDDNDSVEDGADQFPLDARGSKDSDNDGMPDQWETDNGLDPNDASDAESDTDFDGFTALQEFEADTSPLVSDQNTQIIYHEFSPFVAGFSNNVKVFYRPSDGVSDLTGLGLRVHFNSQLVEPLVIENILLLDLVSLGTEPMPDAADFDNDPSTDSFINIAWAATSGSSWPGGSPVKLFDMKVKFSDSVTADSTINIKFTSSSTHSGYGFSSVPIITSVNLNSLDIDGNGNPDALSDGLLILRSLFGLTDAALIQNVVATDATFSSASEIQSRINDLGDFLDIDGNGVVDPLSDGLLILRYMFGIRGADLINLVIAPDATRTTADQVEAYLAKMTPSI